MLKYIALWLRDRLIKSKSLNATRIVAGSFAVIILVGAVLLTLPVPGGHGQSAGFFTALFTATSSTCVTGLILVDTAVQWTLFGQVVILAMIQLGGLGFMTVITLISFALRRRIGELRQAARELKDEEDRRLLRRRITELTPLLQETRELAALTAHYYDRSYHRHERYTL